MMVSVGSTSLLARRGVDGAYLLWAAQLQTGACGRHGDHALRRGRDELEQRRHRRERAHVCSPLPGRPRRPSATPPRTARCSG
ncbi:MAG: hypothetical protein R2838_14725 [Caldilineaceae bacterium]